MDRGMLWRLVLLGCLFALSAFFSASETAIMSLGRVKVKSLAEGNDQRGKTIGWLMEDPGKLLGAILVGNNAVNVGASALATSLAITRFGTSGIGIATVIMTVLVLIFGEITPKTLAARHAERLSLRVAPVLAGLTVMLTPVTTVLTGVVNGFMRVFGGKRDSIPPFLTQEELRTLVDVSHEEGILEGSEKQMIHNVIEFADTPVSEVMTPRTDMVAIEAGTKFREVVEVFRREQYSRIPVYQDTVDNVIGVLHVKDLLLIDEGTHPFQLDNVLREAYFTYEFKRTGELFDEMRKKRASLAVVLDEYGGTAGMVTVEDLVEEIMGEIGDEYDEEGSLIDRVKENEFLADGRAKIDLVNERLGLNLESDYCESIGGYVISKLDRYPEAGEVLDLPEVRFVVITTDRKTIGRMKIVKKIPPAEQ